VPSGGSADPGRAPEGPPPGAVVPEGMVVDVSGYGMMPPDVSGDGGMRESVSPLGGERAATGGWWGGWGGWIAWWVWSSPGLSIADILDDVMSYGLHKGPVGGGGGGAKGGDVMGSRRANGLGTPAVVVGVEGLGEGGGAARGEGRGWGGSGEEGGMESSYVSSAPASCVWEGGRGGEERGEGREEVGEEALWSLESYR
jgi:hypothetical protein